MNRIIVALAFFFITTANAQTFTLTVSNGYGSTTTFQAGDTLHIWSIAFDSTKVFVKWAGDTAGIANAGEWHTTLIAPAHNVLLTANLRSVNSYAIAYEKIRGKNNLKNVYSCFPSGMKGVVYCLHGTSGHAVNWTSSLEYRQFVNAAIADSFAVIITEAEEITLNNDINGDGKLRWFTFPMDSVNNVDYANIKAITDTFIRRGKMMYSTPRYSVGMSNGGAFSAALSMLYKYGAGVSYCAPSSSPVINYTTTPLQFSMAKYDDNVNVGTQGNADALTNYNTLASRSICAAYYLHDRSPCYPQRFARIAGVSVSASQNIFNEFIANGVINNRNFFTLSADTIAIRIQNNPFAFLSIVALNVNQRAEIISQIAAMNAAHQFYSDLNRTTLNFLSYPCGIINAVIISNGPDTFCAGSSVTLSATNGSDLSYQWYNNNIVISGAIGSDYIATATGNYSVKISGAHGTTAISNFITITVNALPSPQITPASANICPGSSIVLSTTATFSKYLWSTGGALQSISATAAGTYTVTVTNSSGCTASASAVVTATSTCNTPTNLFASAISASSATLNWSASVCAFSYKVQYRKKGTTAWTSSTLNAADVSKIISGLTAFTTYQWKIRTQCSSGTANQSNWSAIQSLITAASAARSSSPSLNLSKETEFSVYPNPASRELNILFPFANNFSIEVLDAFGRSVLSTQSHKGINISQLSNGIYYIKLKTDSNCYTQKFIKE